MTFVERLRYAAVSSRILITVLFVTFAALAAETAFAQAPGSTRVTIKNPDPAKWAGRNNFLSGSSGEFTCRPLACPARSNVTASIKNSPTRSPDRKALAKLASKMSEAVALANVSAAERGNKIRRISGGTATLRGYPAIVQDLRIDGGKGTLFACNATIFVKSALVTISSYSMARETARHNRDLFIRAMVVEDTPLRQ